MADNIPVNYHISKDEQGDNYAYSGKPGLGTIAMIAPVQIDDWSKGSEPDNGDVSVLYGLRSIRGPNIATNTISAAHHQSTGGFMVNYPGLRDGGTFDFEANFNPGPIPWQDPEMAKQGALAKSIMESPLFLHQEWGDGGGLPMMQMIVAPASMNHLWYMRGFLAMLGPVTYEMEDIVKATISFKISGRPFLATPSKGADPAAGAHISRTKTPGGDPTDRTFKWYADMGSTFGDGVESYPAYWLETA